MSSFPLWFRYVALACAAFIAAGAFWPIRVLSDFLVLVGVLAALGAAVTGFRKRRDPYSLEALKEIDEREELRNLDVPDALGVDQRLCMCCQQVYDVRYPTCPHCEGTRRRR